MYDYLRTFALFHSTLMFSVCFRDIDASYPIRFYDSLELSPIVHTSASSTAFSNRVLCVPGCPNPIRAFLVLMTALRQNKRETLS